MFFPCSLIVLLPLHFPAPALLLRSCIFIALLSCIAPSLLLPHHSLTPALLPHHSLAILEPGTQSCHFVRIQCTILLWFAWHIKSHNKNGKHYNGVRELAFKTWPGSTERITLLSRPAPTEFSNGCARYFSGPPFGCLIRMQVLQQEVLCVRQCAWLFSRLLSVTID